MNRRDGDAGAGRPGTEAVPYAFFGDWPAWAARFLKLISRTWRLRIVGQPDPVAAEPFIMAHWHGDDLVLTPALWYMNAVIMVSQSRDGARLSRALETLGHHTCRGSSSRGGAAGLLALKKALATGYNASFAADGPRGPRLTAKPGPAYLAAKTGRLIYPIGVAVSRAYVFAGSWHQTRLPWPGTRVVINFGPPLRLPPEATRWPAHHQSRIVTAALADAARAAELMLADWI